MRALRLDSLNVDQLRELDELYRTTRDVRVRTRAQMILLAAEQRLAISEVAAIVRESGETVRRWIRHERFDHRPLLVREPEQIRNCRHHAAHGECGSQPQRAGNVLVRFTP